MDMWNKRLKIFKIYFQIYIKKKVLYFVELLLDNPTVRLQIHVLCVKFFWQQLQNRAVQKCLCNKRKFMFCYSKLLVAKVGN